jgi:cbb3-type cytochrome oxidase subunit 3
LRWWITLVILVVLVGLYVWLYLYTRKRQKKFDEQYNAAKERHEIFVLNKKITKESAQNRWMRFAKFKTYHVVGRVSVSQKVKGIQMSRMQTVNFHTTKSEYEKIQVNHKYKMDIAGNYIGYVHAPLPSAKGKNQGKSSSVNKVKGFFGRFIRH